MISALYPGIETGTAIARVLFGETSPASRLPFTVPASTDQLPEYTDYNMTAAPFGRTFRFWKVTDDVKTQPLFEYGYGLSYALFNYSDLQIQPAAVSCVHAPFDLPPIA
jgi:beta-glucosidase